jgi:1,4-dihydroxy-2-naphthoate octaprenyltransferase
MRREHSLKDWIIATRPWSFPASVMPVLVTLGYFLWRGYCIDWGIGILTVVDIVLFHAAGNTWSDYFDYTSGIDEKSDYSVRTLVDALFSPKQIMCMAIILLVVSVVLGLLLLWLTTWKLLLFGIGGALCVILYPLLKYKAMGDVVIAISYGILPTLGMSVVISGSVDFNALFVAVPVGMITIAILHANNIRDMFTDEQAKIVTVAMKLGMKKSVRLQMFWLIAPFIFIVVCVISGIFPSVSLVCLIALVPALAQCRQLCRYKFENVREICNLDQRAAQLQLLFSLLLFISFIVDCYL